MLEGLVATLLNRFLGVYVQNFDPKQLNVGIWSGDVKLRDLELRKEALDQLKLPINVVEGHIGLLTLAIPWSNLKGKPVKVFVEDVFLLAAPKEDAAYDEAEEEKRKQAVKMEKLENAEMLKERSGDGLSQEEQQKNQSFTDSLVTKIIDNLQVAVKNIHIRYEDAISAPGHPFALGVTLQEFSAVSTDGEWKPTFIQTSPSVTNKLATLGALAIYWNTDATLIGVGKGTKVGPEAQESNHDSMLEQFRNLIVKSDEASPSEHQFILKPVSGRARIEIDKTGKVDRPRIKAGLLFDEIGFILDADQYRDALMMVDLFHYFLRQQEYRKYQPKDVTPKEDPRAWLKFGGDCILSKIHERNRQWSWDYFKERRDDRVRYIELFKKKKQEPSLAAAESEELTKLEEKLSYQDLRFWRSLARSQLRKENAVTQKAQEAQQKQSWIAWAWGSGKQESHGDESTTMTDQQRKELYDAIDWNEKTAIAESVDLPKETIKLQLEASLRTGSFALKRDPHDHPTEILTLLFDSFKAKFLQRPTSFLADLSLGGLRVYDGSTKGSLFPQIVRVKDAPSTTSVPKDEKMDLDADAPELEKNLVDPFFQLQLEQNPLDNHANTAVTAKLKSMEVIYDPNFIVEIVRFFKPPETHMESIGALMDTASATVEGLRQQTRAGLEFALEEHKTIDAKLDLQAPLIIIPESVKEEHTICLILDAGHISLNSDLVDKATIKDIQAKQKQQYSDEDYEKLESLMYDKFVLNLDSTQVLIGPSIQETKSQLQSEESIRNLHIVDRINIDFTVETSIIPKAPNITKFRISGHLPVLHVSISNKKYKNLMRMIDVAIPKFDAPEQPTNGKSQQLAAPKDRSSRRLSKARPMDLPTSFQFSAQHNEILLEDDDPHATSKEEFTEASEISGDDSLKLQQRNFEFRFHVDALRGSLYRSDSDESKPDKLLVELVAEHFQLNFCQRPFDMSAEVSLRSLTMEDYIDENAIPEFKKIISSEGFDTDKSLDLFHVKYVKVNKQSPEYMTKYDGIDTNIDVSISTINLVVTRKTLLTLLDFILVTFTSSESTDNATSSSVTQPEEGSDNEEAAPKATDADKMRIKVNLKSIVLILNNDGLRLATLSLNSADVGIFLMGKTMRIGSHLGNFSLVDDINQGASEDSALRQLITNHGDELADFRYETFDPESGETFPGYNSSIYLKSGSIKVNFLEEPFRKIIDFAVKFGKMQAIFNAARQAAANQASQIQENANMIRFDILIKTPIIVFPRMTTGETPKRDLLTAYLGEIYANNRFVPLDDSESSPTVNKLEAGIRNVRLTSDFHYEDEKSEELELLNKVDVGFNITYLEHAKNAKRPDLEIRGSMSEFNVRISQTQLKFLLELSRSVPAAFTVDAEENAAQAGEELPSSTVEEAKALTNKTDSSPAEDEVGTTDLGPELEHDSKDWTKLDLKFTIKTIGLELLLAKPGEAVGDLAAASLSSFSLNDSSVKVRIMNSGALESEFLIHSFEIEDSRTRETNKFRKIMSSINKDVDQFMANLTISGGSERNLIAITTIDSPRIIFALDYLFAIQNFVSEAFSDPEPLDVQDSSDDETPTIKDNGSTNLIRPKARSKAKDPPPMAPEELHPPSSPMSIAFRVNVVDAQVILIANPQVNNTEAIVLSTKQVLLAQQHAFTLQITQVGMFLCRMDKFDTSRLRVLDDFTLQMSMDSRSQDKSSSLTSIHIDIEPLVLRLSLRDILLALQIVNKASELSGKDEIERDEPEKLKQLEGKSSLKKRSASGKGGSTTARKTAKPPSTKSPPSSTTGSQSAVMKREELTAQIAGLRLILIGDLHELPLLDVSVHQFNVDARDWSGAMVADTSIDTFINVYNFSKSSWEPLIEPWQLGFHMSKETNPECLAVELYSRKMLEITLTSATIALASKSAKFLSQDEDNVLSKPRGADSPYRIRNYTGFDLNVWAETLEDDRAMAAKLSDGEEAPWRFEEWEKMRENLAPEGNSGVIGIKLENSGFDSVSKILVTKEGETIYTLRPRKDKILHRLLVDVQLGADNVKYITFRSPLSVENNTQIPIEIGVFNPEEGDLLKIEKIQPGESRPAPVGAAFIHSLLVRPDEGFGYTWSSENMFWKDLLNRPTKTMTCKGEGGDRTPPFYFQLSAIYDKKNPLTRYLFSES